MKRIEKSKAKANLKAKEKLTGQVSPTWPIPRTRGRRKANREAEAGPGRQGKGFRVFIISCLSFVCNGLSLLWVVSLVLLLLFWLGGRGAFFKVLIASLG